MERTPVTSSNIRSIGYDRTAHTLEVEFHSGGVYQYQDVPEATYDELMASPSVGNYFHKNIRPNHTVHKVQ